MDDITETELGNLIYNYQKSFDACQEKGLTKDLWFEGKNRWAKLLTRLFLPEMHLLIAYCYKKFTHNSYQIRDPEKYVEKVFYSSKKNGFPMLFDHHSNKCSLNLAKMIDLYLFLL